MKKRQQQMAPKELSKKKSLSLQKRDFHRSAVCPRLWHDFEGIFKKNNEVGYQILHTRETVLSGSDIQFGVGRFKGDETSSSC